MMIKYLILFTLFLSTTLFGQAINDSLLATFYNKTLEYYFPKTKVNEDQTKFGKILIQTKFDTSRLIKNSGRNVFVFIHSTTNQHSLLDRPFRKNINRSIYRINHKTFVQDTIDINIGGWTIKNVINGNNIALAGWCGGTMGYIPDGRFLYSKNTNSWTFLNRDEIINQKISSGER